ncbi:hypothetical protein Q9295_03070 [Xinfangfangia sp. CPCC 101601]|uniref:UrcA family protein n=1 Tax=Pseudogemmobacter lacusdianii TaxID=3069608 RepID=A0ABU0VUG1_9RHOB|nr:hypothetical protein [Xinfangfangia sp. CPCC 101601]MDQ2065343.1 hypothetical protein [Xinfangfangia sp. CPCC 101601]
MTISQTQIGRGEGKVSARRSAGLVTAGALAFALMLGLGLPARAAALAPIEPNVTTLLSVQGPVSAEAELVRQKKRPSARIPAVCAMEIGERRHRAVVYPERCLRRQGVEVRLPRECAKMVRIRGKHERVYTERCLRDEGFRIGGGRGWGHHRY